MNIGTTGYNISPQGFRAKVPIASKEALKGTALYSATTPLDTLFNENSTVRTLNNFAENLKKNILCKYFQTPTNVFSRTLALAQYKVITLARILSDRVFLFTNKKAINELNKNFTNLNPNSKEYIDEFATFGNTVKDKFIIANTEDKTLEKIADSKRATIFVMNHPNYNKDKFTYAIINSMLNKLYVAKNRQADCPRPKILVSRNMLKIVHPKVAAIYQKLGLVPVDASLKGKDRTYNARAMKNLLIEFIQNKSNVFFFPEGNNSSYKNMALEDKIQPGIAQFIQKAIAIKKNVRVVPIGVDYPAEKNNLGKIHIGKPLYFINHKNQLLYTEGTEHRRVKKAENIKSINTILKTICDNMAYEMEKAKTVK